MPRQHRGGGEQLGPVGKGTIGREGHPRGLLARLAVDRGDVGVSRRAGGIEIGHPAGLREPGQHHVFTGHRLAVGVDGLFVDGVVEHQRNAAHYLDGAEIVIGDHLTIGSVEAETGEHTVERLCSGRGITRDAVDVVCREATVDGVIQRFRRRGPTRGQQPRREQHRGRNGADSRDSSCPGPCWTS
ncbi:Uncharacterised protein [Mycobacteroides abscessus subsp. massiliense]|nr:Uncharacterised protein [Mycobacteroides abscessus subsp. massiliense]